MAKTKKPPEAAEDCSPRPEPWEQSITIIVKPRRGERIPGGHFPNPKFLSPLRGLFVLINACPTAHAVGYILSPLTGLRLLSRGLHFNTPTPATPPFTCRLSATRRAG